MSTLTATPLPNLFAEEQDEKSSSSIVVSDGIWKTVAEELLTDATKRMDGFFIVSGPESVIVVGAANWAGVEAMALEGKPILTYVNLETGAKLITVDKVPSP